MVSTNSPRTRHWSDVLALVTGVGLIGLVIWPGGPTSTNAAAAELRFPVATWLVHAGAGALAVAGATLAQRWSLRQAGRAMIVAGALLLLANLLVVREFGLRSLLTLLLPSLALLAAAVGVGPMPRSIGPEYDATRRPDLGRSADREVERDVALGADTGTRTRTNFDRPPSDRGGDRPAL